MEMDVSFGIESKIFRARPQDAEKVKGPWSLRRKTSFAGCKVRVVRFVLPAPKPFFASCGRALLLVGLHAKALMLKPITLTFAPQLLEFSFRCKKVSRKDISEAQGFKNTLPELEFRNRYRVV
jgi:hypothetical protein